MNQEWSRLLPQLTPCRSLSLGARCLFIAAGGFEDRCIAAATRIEDASRLDAVVIMYDPVDSKNRPGELMSVLRSRGLRQSKVASISFDRTSPDTFSAKVASHIQYSGTRHVILDVSGLSKLAILLVLDVVSRSPARLTMLYTEAHEYAPSREVYENAKRDQKIHRPSLQIFGGVSGVVRSTALSSVAMQGQPSAAIAFMSFNELVTQALVNAVYPSRLLLINGRPPKLHWREEATAWIHEELRRDWPESDNPVESHVGFDVAIPQRVTSTLDYRETAEKLNELYWTLAVDHRIILAPTGSKMQTVGCFLAKAMHPDIHIEYPTPKGYLESGFYSKGVGDVWAIDFGSLKGLVAALRAEERGKYLRIAPTSDVPDQAAHRRQRASYSYADIQREIILLDASPTLEGGMSASRFIAHLPTLLKVANPSSPAPVAMQALLYPEVPVSDDRVRLSVPLDWQKVLEELNNLTHRTNNLIPSWELLAAIAWDSPRFADHLAEAQLHMETGRQRLAIPVNELTEEGIDLLRREDHALAVTSEVTLEDGSRRHIAMMDFRVSAAPSVLRTHRDRLVAVLRGMGERAGVLFRSGASFHYYGLKLLTHDEWRTFLGRALLVAPLVDARYVAHRLIEGFGVLRIHSSKDKPTTPHLVGTI